MGSKGLPGSARYHRLRGLLRGVAAALLAAGALWAWLGPLPAQTGPRIALVAGVVFVGLAVVGLLEGRLEKPSDGMVQLAIELDLDFHGSEPPGMRHAIEDFELYRYHPKRQERGRRRGPPPIGPGVQGAVDGLDVTVAGLTLQTVVLARDPDWHLPRLVIEPEGVGTKVAARLGSGDVDFPEDPDFSSAFSVRGTDEASVRRMVGPELRSRLGRMPDLTLETMGSAAVAYWKGPPTGPEVRERLPRIVGIFRALVDR